MGDQNVSRSRQRNGHSRDKKWPWAVFDACLILLSMLIGAMSALQWLQAWGAIWRLLPSLLFWTLLLLALSLLVTYHLQRRLSAPKETERTPDPAPRPEAAAPAPVGVWTAPQTKIADDCSLNLWRRPAAEAFATWPKASAVAATHPEPTEKAISIARLEAEAQAQFDAQLAAEAALEAEIERELTAEAAKEKKAPRDGSAGTDSAGTGQEERKAPRDGGDERAAAETLPPTEAPATMEVPTTTEAPAAEKTPPAKGNRPGRRKTTAPKVQNQAAMEEKATRSQRYVELAKEYVANHYQQSNLSLNEISESTGLSSAYLSRVFTDQTGESLSSYINYFRIAKARELLTGSDIAIPDLAEQCGFNSRQSFHRVFLKYVGYPPSQYRENGGSPDQE